MQKKINEISTVYCECTITTPTDKKGQKPACQIFYYIIGILYNH